MGKKKSERVLKVSRENRERLAKMYACSERMVVKALCFESISLLAKRIQYTARKEMGAWVEAAVPEEEILYDTMDNGERFMRQYFSNGAVLEINLITGNGWIRFKGEKKLPHDNVLLTDIPHMQEIAKSMK